jgi:hypothetical protein
MISGLNATGSLMVTGGQPSGTYYQTGQPMSGMVRYINSCFEVYDGSTWHRLQSTYSTISLNSQAETAIEWAKKKMLEEEVLLSMPSDHPAVKIARENVNRAKQALREAEDQLKVTLALSEE